MKYKLILLLVFTFLLLNNFVLAQNLYENCQIYGNCKPIGTTSPPVNYSLVNVNNSQYFQGYTPTTLGNWLQSTFNWITNSVSTLTNYYSKTDINNFNASYLDTTNTSYVPYTGAINDINLDGFAYLAIGDSYTGFRQRNSSINYKGIGMGVNTLGTPPYVFIQSETDNGNALPLTFWIGLNKTTTINETGLYENGSITASQFFGNLNYSYIQNVPIWNATNTSYALASQWNATNESYMTEENFTLQNTSMKNYVLYVNSTNTGGSDANWNANYSNVAFINKANLFGAYNQTFDTSTLFIDSTNHRVGIGTTIPGGNQISYAPPLLHVNGTSIYGTTLAVENIGSTGLLGVAVVFKSDSSARGKGFIMYDSSSKNTWGMGVPYSGSSKFQIGYIPDYTAVGTFRETETLRGTTDAKLTILGSSGNVGIGTTNPTTILNVNGTFSVINTTGIQGLYQNAAGKVGIGTTSPGTGAPAGSYDTRLHIVGNGSGVAGRTAFVVQNTNNDSAADFMLCNILGNCINAQISSPAYAIGEQAGFSTTGTGGNSGPNLVFSTDGNLASGGKANITFATGGYAAGQERMRLDFNGNLGIGTSNPFVKLHVNGNILANGTINATVDVCVNGNCLSNVSAVGGANWNANYSTFLTHINWSQVMNGTLFKTSQWNATNTSYLEIKNWNATNTSYALASQWNATNTSYMTGENFTLQNTSMRNYVDWVNTTNSAGGEPLWSANFSNVAFINKANLFGAYNQTFNTNTFFVDSTNGRVGIGTASPTKMLDIRQNADDNAFIFYGYDDKATSWGKGYINSEGFFNWDTDTRFQYRVAGILIAQAFGSQFDIYSDATNNRYLSFGNGVIRMGYNHTIDRFEVSDASKNLFLTINDTGNVANFDFNQGKVFFNGTSGNVGIGIANPLQLLHVNGSILANGTINATGSFGIGGIINVSGLTENSTFMGDVKILGTLYGASPVKINGGIELINGNITTSNGDYFIGDGSKLTNLSAGVNGLNGTNGTNGMNGINGTNGLNGNNGTDSINNTNWNANFTAFNTSWSNTYNSTENASINNYILSNNNSIVNWVTSTFSSLANTMTALGNWSADKINYPTLNILNNGSYLNYPWNATNTSYLTSSSLTPYLLISNWNSTNTSYLTSSSLTPYLLISNWNSTNTSYLTSTGNIGNWTLDKPSYTLLSVLNNGSYFNTASSDTFIANYSTFLTHMTMANATTQNDSMRNYVGIQNTSMTNWISNVFNVTRNNEVTRQNQSIVNWANSIFATISQLSDYMTGSNFTLQNTSMKNYILYVNSTNGAGGGSPTLVSNITCSGTDKVSAYNNITGAFVCSTDSTGAGSSITEWYNTSRTNYTSNSATGFTIISDLNTTLVLLPNTNYTFFCNILFTSNTTTTGIAINMLTATAPKRIAYMVNIPIGADGTDSTWLGQGTASNDTIVGTGVEAVNVNYKLTIDGIIQVNTVKNAVVPTYRSEVAKMVVNVTEGSNCRWTLLNG